MNFRNRLSLGFKIVEYNLFKKSAPLNVKLSLNNSCNARCNYCNFPNRSQKELTTNQIFSLIDQLENIGTKRLGLCGGEPLLRKDVGDIIDYAKEKGLFVTLNSNGYLLSKKIEDLKNLDILILSFDGPEKAHDTNKEKGSFRKVMEAFKAARKLKKIWTITVLTKYNTNSIDFIIKMAKKYNFSTSFQIICNDSPLIRNTEKFLSSNEEYKRVIKKLIDEKKRGAPIILSFKTLKELLEWKNFKITSFYDKNSKCYAGKLFCHIDTDGSVYPCSMTVGKMKSKNFLDEGFKNAFESIKDSPCTRCGFAPYIEYNNIFSLNLEAILNSSKQLS